MMAFRRTTLKSKSGGVFRPIAAPIKHVVIREIVPGLLFLYGYRFELRVVPNQRPEILSIDLAEPFQPFGHALRFAALKSLCHPVEQVVVRIEMSLRMRARIFVTLVRARQRAFEYVAKIKDVI